MTDTGTAKRTFQVVSSSTSQENPEPKVQLPKTLVLAIGAGGIAITTFIAELLEEISSKVDALQILAVDTDARTLRKAHKKNIPTITLDSRGHGAGGKAENAEKMVREKKQEFENAFEGLDLVIIVTSHGGGTGSGASIVLAEIAKEKGAKVIAMVQVPLTSENRGPRLKSTLVDLHENVDGICVIDSDPVFKILAQKADMFNESFDSLYKAVGQRLLSILAIVLGDTQDWVIDISDINACMMGDEQDNKQDGNSNFRTFYIGIQDLIQKSEEDPPDSIEKEFEEILAGYFSRFKDLCGAINLILVNVAPRRKGDKLTIGDQRKLTDLLKKFTEENDPPPIKFGTMSFDFDEENPLPHISLVATLRGGKEILFTQPEDEGGEETQAQHSEPQTAVRQKGWFKRFFCRTLSVLFSPFKTIAFVWCRFWALVLGTPGKGLSKMDDYDS